MHNKYLSTGQSSRVVQATEPRLADLVRRGKIQPEPVIIAGRRMWDVGQVRQAAEYFGTLTPDIERLIIDAFGSDANVTTSTELVAPGTRN